MAVFHASTVLLPVLPWVFPRNTPAPHACYPSLFQTPSLHKQGTRTVPLLKQYLLCSGDICRVSIRTLGITSPLLKNCIQVQALAHGPRLSSVAGMALPDHVPTESLLLPDSECTHSGHENKKRPGSFDLFVDVKYLQICGTESHPTLCLHNRPLQLTTLGPVISYLM